MKHFHITPSGWFTLIVALLIAAALFLLPRPGAGLPELNVGYTSSSVEARVETIIEEGEIQLDEQTSQPYQIVEVRLLEGEYAGLPFRIDLGLRQLMPEGFQLRVGERILVTVSKTPENVVNVYFIDYVRTDALLILGLIFAAASMLVSGWKGLRSLLSIGFSLVVIIYFIVPNILAGYNPILISLAGSFVFLAVTQYLVYGWTLKSQIAMTGITITVVLTGILSVVFVDAARLNGFGDENAMFLAQQAGNINIRNLLVAGFIIGTLGVLDDLVIGQTSSVIEIYLANPALTFRQRYRAAMNIGRDHVAATVNTLVLAYLGVSLSMFLLFSLNNVEFGKLLSTSMVAEEIVRSLVGTLGLFAAVPITTTVACWVVDQRERLEKFTRWFGPLTDEYGH